MPNSTRHVAYAVTATGRVSRTPFASMPTDAALRYVAADPTRRVHFVPALPEFSRLTGHWSDCATYETLDAADCECWARLEDDDDGGGDHPDGIDRQAEDNYRTKSPSVTGIREDYV